MDELIRFQPGGGEGGDLCQELAHGVAQVREKMVAKVVCESRLSVQTQPVTENTASTVGAGNKARK